MNNLKCNTYQLKNLRITKAQTLPSIALIAAEAPSFDVKVTKPNPLDLPVSRSVITRAERTKKQLVNGILHLIIICYTAPYRNK
jgi:hypothetical protein